MKIALLLAAAVGVILGVGWTMTHRQLREAKAELERLQPAGMSRAPIAPAQEREPRPTPGARSLAADKPASPAPSRPKAVSDNPMLKKMGEMMKQPGMKMIIRQQLATQTDADYVGLYAELGLNDEEKMRLKELIVDRQMSAQEWAMTMTTKTAEETGAGDLKSAMKRSDEQIREFLGDPADFERFQHYEKTQPARMQFRMFGGRQIFADSGEPLSSGQEEQLIELMTKAQPAARSQKTGSEAILEAIDRQAREVRLQATGFLTQQQLDTLEKWQADRRKMTEASLEMSKAFMPPDAPR